MTDEKPHAESRSYHDTREPLRGLRWREPSKPSLPGSAQKPTSRDIPTLLRCSARSQRAKPDMHAAASSTSQKSATQRPVSRLVTRKGTSRRPSWAKRMSSPKCTPASHRPLAMKDSTRSPTGSRRSPGLRRVTPKSSPKDWPPSEACLTIHPNDDHVRPKASALSRRS